MWVTTTDLPPGIYFRLLFIGYFEGIDSEHNIVRRHTGESYEEFLTKLAKASGTCTPTRADLARLDRKCKKKGANDEWTQDRGGLRAEVGKWIRVS